MDMQKLSPWNWFKHEEKAQDKNEVLPVKQGDYMSSPTSSMLQLHREIDRLFDDAFRGFPSLGKSSSRMFKDDFMPAFHAKVNVASDDKQYRVTLEAPGLEEKDISVDLKDGALFIKGNKQQEHEEKDQHYYRMERSYGSFERVLAIPDDGNIAEITANMKNGVLTISIPRREMPQSNTKRIRINS